MSRPTCHGFCVEADRLPRQRTSSRAAPVIGQPSTLLEPLPSVDHFEFGAYYVPARGEDNGGDWYDCLVIDDYRTVLVVGDVMGKGVAASAEMNRVRSAVRSLVSRDPRPAAVLTALEALADDIPITGIVTMACVLVDSYHGVATVGRAGHLPPLLSRADGTVDLVVTGGSPPLGTPGAGHGEATVNLDPGSLLVLYTDGLVEDRVIEVDRGTQWLIEAVARTELRRLSPAALAEYLVANSLPEPKADDTAVLVARFQEAPACRAA